MSKSDHAYREVGHRIAMGRAQMGALRGKKVTQQEVADAVGVSLSTVTAWEIGKQRPEGDNLSNLASFLGMEEGYILTGRADLADDYDRAREEAELARAGAIPDPLLRIMERESIAAVIRAQGVRDACRAARLEAENAAKRSELARPAYQRTPMKPQPRQDPKRKKGGEAA